MQRKNLLYLGLAVGAVVAIGVTTGVLVSQKKGDSSSPSSSTTSSAAANKDAVDGGGGGTAMPESTSSVSPSVSLFPTASPTFVTSQSPTFTGTSSPSVSPQPTAPPTLRPSSAPSKAPTQAPSVVPTTEPSAAASVVPTSSISAVPTAAPTPTASESPTSLGTAAPTETTVDPDLEFRIKMHWKREFEWQDETRERRWCMACAQCDELNFAEFPDDYNCQESDTCQADNNVWLLDCDEDEQGELFRAITYPDGVMLQVVDTQVCLTRTRQRYLTIQVCNDLDIAQKWMKPITQSDEFILRPAYFHVNDAGVPFCITQHHHPKPEEILGLKSCDQAYLWDTAEWEVYTD